MSNEILIKRAQHEKVLYAKIQEDQKNETNAVEKRLGRKLTIKDGEFWQISEKYRQRYFDEIMNPRKILQKKIDNDAKIDLENPAFLSVVPVGERACRDCGGIIAPTGKRGRPPTKCASCRDKKSTKKKVEVISV